MEHESFVPIPPARLTQALRSRAVLAESLPGWQPDRSDAATATDARTDAAADPATPAPAHGRLRLRVAGSTITYRGTVTLIGDSSPFTLEAQGEEVRGSGTVKARVELALAATEQPEPGTALTYRGSAEAAGRLTSYDDAVVESAVRRLLDRFSAELAAHAPEVDAISEEAPAGALEADADADEAAGTTPDDATAGTPDRVDDEAAPDRPTGETPSETPGETSDEAAAEAPDVIDDEAPDVMDEEAPDVVDDDGEPAPSSDMEEFELVEVEVEVPESAAALDDLVTPAEAAHARRTMIGRSAEEVDHAPPRGRYAPVPAPDAGGATATLRWAAPAAAALLASAVVVGRVLRRRR